MRPRIRDLCCTPIRSVSIIVSALLLTGCGASDNEPQFDRLQAQPMPLSVDTIAQLGTNEPLRPLPEIDPASLHTPMVSLGRQLFHDTRLSGDGTMTCASCHAIDQGGDDNNPTSEGIRGQIGPINAPTVLNSGYKVKLAQTAEMLQ